MTSFSLTSLSGEVYPIEGERLFGRSPECNFPLQDPEVSRRHATVYVSPRGLVVRDEGSANGTFVNGQRIEAPTVLSHNDTIRMGNTVLTAQLAGWEPANTVLPGLQAAPPPTPSPSAAAAVSPPRPAATPRKRSLLPLVLIGCGGLAMLVICGLLVFVLLARSGGGSSTGQTYSLEDALSDPTSDDRAGVVAYLGLPDAFTIEGIMVDGKLVRMESWRYYGFGLRVDFVDGEASWTMDIDPVPEDSLLPAWYDPRDFKLGMPVAQASAVAQAASPAEMAPVPMDLSEGGEDLAGATMLTGDQILMGLDNTGLVYVETVGLLPQGGE